MSQRSRLPLPRALTMPLRDVLRGVTSVADVTEEVLEPAAALLPGPVRATFRSALASVEGAGARVVTPVIDHNDIDMASAFLQGSDISRTALETFVSVLAFVWERSLSKDAGHPTILFSETIVAASLVVTGPGKAVSAHARAAAVLMALRRTNAVSRLPRHADGTVRRRAHVYRPDAAFRMRLAPFRAGAGICRRGTACWTLPSLWYRRWRVMSPPALPTRTCLPSRSNVSPTIFRRCRL